MKFENLKKSVLKNKELFLAVFIFIFSILLFLGVPGSIKLVSGNNLNSFEIIEIVDDNCSNCFDLNLVYDSVFASQNFEIKSKDVYQFDSEKGNKTIEEYGIKKIPSLIVKSKNIEKIGLDPKLFEIYDKYAIFNSAIPYYDLEGKNVEGIVDFVEVQKKDCFNCTSLSGFVDKFESTGIKVGDYELVDFLSEKGQGLVFNMNLVSLPAFFVSEDIEKYSYIFDSLKPVLVERGDYYLLDVPRYPRFNLKTGNIEGEVDAIFLINDSCKDCFSTELYRKQFSSMGVYFANQKEYDISLERGQNLLEKYDIDSIPSLILSSDIQDYKYLKKFILEVGTIEEGGEFVFRDLDGFGANYQKL